MLNILQALLAFAVTMLGLSTVATVILEVLARLSRRRARVFNHMLGILFVEEIAPRLRNDQRYGDRVADLERSMNNAGEEAKSLLKAFQDSIADSPLELEKDTSRLGKASVLFRWLGTDRETDMTAEHFARRLARTSFGRDLYTRSRAHIDATIEQVTLRFDELAEEASRYIKVSSAILCLLIGIAIAFVANIDGYRLLQFYIGNPEIAAKVGAQAEAQVAEYERARAKLVAAINALETPAATLQGAEAAEAREEIQAIRDDLTAVQEHVQALVGLGLPVGADYFPYCRWREATGTPSRYEHCFEERYKPLVVDRLAADYVTWFLSVFVTGMLIGLGGPFWYDAVKGLMRATQMLRGKDATSPEAKAEATAFKARSPAEAFRTILGASPAPAAPAGGPLWLPASWTGSQPATEPDKPKEPR